MHTYTYAHTHIHTHIYREKVIKLRAGEVDTTKEFIKYPRKGKNYEKIYRHETPQEECHCQTCEDKTRYSEESFVFKNMCKDKRQICKGQVSLGVTGGRRENKNTLKHIELQGEKEGIICS